MNSAITIPFLFKSESFNLGFSKYFSEENKGIRKVLQERNKRIELQTFTYRVINHWEKSGLVESNREQGKGWRRYSICDLLWLNIINELRKFGVSIESLQKIKTALSQHSDKVDSIFPILEFYAASYILNKKPVYLLIFNDYGIEIRTNEEIEITDEFLKVPNHIKISLHDIIQSLVPQYELLPTFESKIRLTSKELEIIRNIRTKNYNEIVIKFKNGEIKSLDKTKVDAEKELYKILKENNYDTVMFNRVEGKIRNVVHTIHQKL